MQIAKYLRRVRSSTVTLNAIFILITQLVNYTLPLISYKYLINVLSVEKFGRISFVQSFIGYLVVIVDYGFNLSATKDVAIKRSNTEAIRKIFYNVVYAKTILLLISFIILIISVIAIDRFEVDAKLYLTFFGVVVGSVLFPQWFFQGIEEMRYITIVNTIIKVAFLGCIFLFIRKETDYVFIPTLYSCSYILPGIYGFALAAKKVGSITLPDVKTITRLFSDGFSIFMSTAMASVLSGSSIFILGLTTTNPALIGYYAGYDRLIKSATSVFTPITIAIYPTVSRKFAESHLVGYQYIKRVGLLTILISVLIAVGLILFSGFLIPFLYNKDFLAYRVIFYILSVWMIVSVANNFIGIQYLTGSGKSKLYGKAFTIAGIMSVPTVYFFTLYYSYTGTAYSVLLSECLLTVLMLLLIFLEKNK